MRSQRFRHVAKYTVLQMDNEHVESVTPFPAAQGHAELEHVAWVPGAAASLVMVHENDLYIKESPSSVEVTRITTTGEQNHVYNGVTDYLYHEYILHSVSAVWANAEGTRLCYAAFNDTAVQDAKIPIYTSIYTTIREVRYPKVDTKNPVATLWAVDLRESTPKPRDLKPPTRVRDQDHYFTSVGWVDEGTIAVTWRNRAQNVSVVTICKEPMWFCDELFVEESGPRLWATVEEVPLFAQNGTAFVSVLPLVDRELGTFPHIHQGDIETKHNTPLTFGPYTVFSVLGWDTENHYVYYVANTDSEAAERHLWRVTDMSAPAHRRQQECLTCFLNYTTPPCRHFTPHMGPDNFNEVVLQCEGPGIPHTVLFSTLDGEVLIYIHNNSDLQQLSEQMAWPQQRNYNVRLDDNFMVKVRLSIPPEFADDEAFIHPMVVRVGGVPGQQLVNHKWNVDWGTYLASNKSWVVLDMDVRGAAGQDLSFMYKPAWKLGEVEVHDHLAVTKSLVSELEFIDGARVVAFGWGHGGYNAARMLSQDVENLFTCATVVNPITDWSLYASYYSERYMGSAQVGPGGNYRGYEESSLLFHAGNFKNKSLFLVYGSGDTDVHSAHTLKFSRALTEKGIIFRQQTYTDEGHDLERVRFHLYRSVEQYMTDCFPPYNEEELSLLFGKDAIL